MERAYHETPLIDEDLLEQRVQMLRDGDKSQIEPITLSLLRFVASLVKPFNHRRRTDDLIGVALLTLAECLDDASNRMHDNNIRAYITTSICHRLKDYIKNDHTARIKSRTLRYLAAKGEEVILPHNVGEASDAPFVRAHGDHTYYISAVARPEYPSLEFTEIIEKLAENVEELRFIQLRIENKTMEETAAALGFRKSYVYNLRRVLEARFDELNGEEPRAHRASRGLHPKMATLVDSNHIGLPAAFELSKLPHEEQLRFAIMAQTANFETLKGAIAQRLKELA